MVLVVCTKNKITQGYGFTVHNLQRSSSKRSVNEDWVDGR